jgi:hypothetical protein
MRNELQLRGEPVVLPKVLNLDESPAAFTKFHVLEVRERQ